MVTRFNIPSAIETLISEYDISKIINSVQSELNKGKNLGSTNASKQDWKVVKDEDGNKRLVIVIQTKAGEKVQLENTNPARFYGWCNTVVSLNTYAATELTLPTGFKTWLDGFAKK
jgi:hypothetical protein